MRLRENTTSSAVISSPLWKVTFSRSLNSITAGSTSSHSVASAGSQTGSIRVTSRPISVSNAL